MVRDAPLEALDFISVDLETTGIAPGYDRITEVAAARFRLTRDGAVVPGRVFESLVDPEREIPDAITELTGIDAETVAGAPHLRDVWPSLLDFMATRPDGAEHSVALAHSARFDLAFLAAAGGKLGRRWEKPEFVCTLTLARRLVPEAPKFALAPLVEWLGCAADGGESHRARPDTLHARNLFARLVSRKGARSLAGLGIRELLRPPPVEELEVEIPAELAELREAIEAGERLSIVYRAGSKGRAPRPITPMAFFARGGVAYLRAWCHIDHVAKSFRCSRIASIRRQNKRKRTDRCTIP